MTTTHHQGPIIGEAAETCRQAVYYHARQLEQWQELGDDPDEIRRQVLEHRQALGRLRWALRAFGWSPRDVKELLEAAGRKAARDVGGE